MWSVSKLCDTWHSLTFSYLLLSNSFLIKEMVLMFYLYPFYVVDALVPVKPESLQALRFPAASGNIQVAQRLDLSEFLPTIVP